MTRALLVSYHYPPSLKVGARRPSQLCATLPQHGIDVHVICPREDGAHRDLPHVTETPRGHVGEWLREQLAPGSRAPLFEQATGVSSQKAGDQKWFSRARLLRTAKNLALVPDEMAPFIRHAVHAADALMAQDERFDVVIGTTPPFSAAVAAAHIAQRHHLPYVIDVRDPYTLNAVNPPGVLDGALRRALEGSILDGAAHVITASEGFARKQATLTGTRCTAIYNAYDERDVAPGPPPPRKAGRLVLAHTGTIYPDTADITPLAQALDAFTAREVTIRSCGTGGAFLRRHLGDKVDDHGMVTREEAAAMRRDADALLLFLPRRDVDDGHVPAKLFDYLGAQRPILAVGHPQSEPGRLLKDAASSVTLQRADAIADWLEAELQAPATPPTTPAAPAADFGADRLSAGFAAVLHDVTGVAPPPLKAC